MEEIVKLKARAYDCIETMEHWQKELQVKTDAYMVKIDFWKKELQEIKDAITVIYDR